MRNTGFEDEENYKRRERLEEVLKNTLSNGSSIEYSLIVDELELENRDPGRYEIGVRLRARLSGPQIMSIKVKMGIIEPEEKKAYERGHVQMVLDFARERNGYQKEERTVHEEDIRTKERLVAFWGRGSLFSGRFRSQTNAKKHLMADVFPEQYGPHGTTPAFKMSKFRLGKVFDDMMIHSGKIVDEMMQLTSYQ